MDSHALLETLQRRTGFTTDHARTLAGLSGVMAPLAPELALAFYDYLGRDGEMREILWAEPGRVERLYGSFSRWYEGLFSGIYNAEYAQSRYRVGLIHARLGIRPSFMIPAMGVVQELSLEHLRMALRQTDMLPAIIAFEKIVAIELALIEESFLNALQQGWAGLGPRASSAREALVHGANLLLKEGA